MQVNSLKLIKVKIITALILMGEMWIIVTQSLHICYPNRNKKQTVIIVQMEN